MTPPPPTAATTNNSRVKDKKMGMPFFLFKKKIRKNESVSTLKWCQSYSTSSQICISKQAPKIPKQLSKYKYSVLKTVKYCNTKYGHFMIIASKAHINV